MSASHALTRAGALSIADSPDGLRLTSPYDPAFLAALKLAIPASARRWDGQRRQWLIDPAHGAQLVKESKTFYGVTIALPGGAASAPPQPMTEIIQLAYLGSCREREDQSVSASGYTLGNRNAKAPDLVFPEAALKAWFDGDGDVTASASRSQQAPPQSLYRVLCVAQDADAATLKTAYRRMARQTHPDVNKEPDAAEQFRRVQAAYDVLSEPLKRRKYDAGLKLAARADQERELRNRPLDNSASVFAAHIADIYGREYRAPLRCGLLLVTGVRRLGRVEVTKILSWQDLTRDGRVLVSSWPQDGQIWEERWVTP